MNPFDLNFWLKVPHQEATVRGSPLEFSVIVFKVSLMVRIVLLIFSVMQVFRYSSAWQDLVTWQMNILLLLFPLVRPR